MDEESLKAAMVDLPVPQVRYFKEIGSSNEEALAWVSQAESAGGAQDGCLVVANSQSQGRGRLGRRWITMPGSSLAFSLILRLTPAEIERLAFFSPLGALAISQALESLGLAPLIKWPNDVLLERRKVAGILVEAAWLGEKLQGVVMGIGLNIAPESVPPAEQLLFPAISVQEAAGSAIDRISLLRAILANIFTWRERLFDPAFLASWEERLAFRGEWVRLEETGGGILTGLLVGLDGGGNLLLRAQDGKVIAVNVGDVHLRPSGAQQ